MEETKADDFATLAGERIQEWVDSSLTHKNGCKRDPNQEDFEVFGSDAIAWMFTQKGEKLFESYLSKTTRLAKKLFPDDEIEQHDIEQHTGVMYP